jgi:pyruvate dehydrogenase E2 component (dihydrolipoamide acetyltransferase)
MPEVAANAVNAILANWLVSEGAEFSLGDALAVVETEKAAVDMAAESDGVLVRVLVANGATVEVGAPVALIADLNESIADVAGELMRLGVGPSPEHVTSPAPVTPPPSASPIASPTAGASDVPTVLSRDGDRIFSSPLARRLARNADFPMTTITGTGPNGRIRRRDVEAAIAGGVTPDVLSVPLTKGTRAVTAFTDTPHTRMRRTIASRLVESKGTAPHFYVSGSCRVDALLSMRATLNENSAVKISINDLVIKAIAKSHMLVPGMNIIWTPEATRQFYSVDISVAIATDGGLLTPVLRGANAMSITDIALATQDFVTRAKIGRIDPTELEGGSVSVTNLGMFGVEEFAAILNPPQSAILAVGAVKREAIVEGDTVTIGSVMRIVLSVDHRPVDGATAARWMKQFVTIVENPVLILA